MGFEEAYEEFKIYASKQHKKESFGILTRDFNCKILPYFKDSNIYDLTEKDILRWKDELLSFNYSKKYLSKIYYVFSIFFDYCCLYYDIERNIVRNVGNFKVKSQKKNSDYYTLKEFEIFIGGFDNNIYKSFFTLMFFTGTRPSEAMALKFSDVKGKYLSINKSIERRGNRELCTTKNIYSVRDVVLCKRVLKCISDLKRFYLVKYGEFSERIILNYKSKLFREKNYFVLYDLNDDIICYFDSFNDLSRILHYRLSDLVHEYNRNKTNNIVVIINNKKYKLATFC